MMTVENQNPPGCVQKIADRMEWRQQFPAHDAPPGPPAHDPQLDAALIDLAVDLDAAAGWEAHARYTSDGVPVFSTFDESRPRPFAVEANGCISVHR